MYYFAYGSNMDEDDLRTWCEKKSKPFPKWKLIGTACLKDYKLVFNYYSSYGRNGGAANLMESPNSKVYGLLFEMNEADHGTIKEKEGYPKYYDEITVIVRCNENILVNVLTYKVVKEREQLEHQKPTEYYMDLILNNARINRFPEEYIRYLERIKTK